jgi:UDP-N-acetylmuramate dehydrogenase
MPLPRSVEEIARDYGCALQWEVPLARLTSAGVGGPAPFLLHPGDPATVADLLSELRAAGETVRVIGSGTNLLAADAGVPWGVLRLSRIERAPRFEGNRVIAPAGCSLPALVRLAVERGLGGIEFGEGIPGSLGGGVVMNAGAFGGEIGPRVRRVSLLRGDGVLEDREPDAGTFGYRSSAFTEEELLLEIELELEPADPERLRDAVRDFRRRRIASQPVGKRTSGCVFRNPPGDSAGRLIDACGLKGRRRGAVVVSERHANFLVNEGGAKANDFFALMEEVREEVLRQTGVELEDEVRIWRS